MYLQRDPLVVALLFACLLAPSSPKKILTTAMPQMKMCTPTDWSRGQWVEGAYERCGLLETYSSAVQPKPWARYCWVPDFCSFEKFSPNGFCEILNNRSIAFVGDSISHQMYKSLAYQLSINPGRRVDVTSVKICGSNSASKLLYYYSNQLDVEYQNRSDKEQNQWAHEDVNLYSILVFNKGAHYYDFEINVTKHHWELYKQYTRNTVQYMKQNIAGKKTLLFRTTPQGHPNCMISNRLRATLPKQLHGLSAAEGWTTNHSCSQRNCFDWHLFPSRNNHIIQELHSLGENVTVLDVVPMTEGRQDGHKAPSDCLHYYLPSVVDNWNLALYNILIYNNVKSNKT